jgi:hypothetical protein
MGRCGHQLAGPQVVPLKKQVNPWWKYCRVQDPTRESGDNIELAKLTDHLKQMFENADCWLTPQ